MYNINNFIADDTLNESDEKLELLRLLNIRSKRFHGLMFY